MKRLLLASLLATATAFATSAQIAQNPGSESFIMKPMPQMRIAFQGGFAYRLAAIDKSLDKSTQDYMKAVKKGLSYGADAEYFISKDFGLGVKYHAFRNALDASVRSNDTGETGQAQDVYNIDCIGPVIASCVLSANGKFSFYVDYGLCYAKYTTDIFIQYPSHDDRGNLTGATLGNFADISADLKLSGSLYAGLNLSLVTGTLKAVTQDINGAKSTVLLESDEYIGIAHISISAGIRFILQKKVQ